MAHPRTSDEWVGEWAQRSRGLAPGKGVLINVNCGPPEGSRFSKPDSDKLRAIVLAEEALRRDTETELWMRWTSQLPSSSRSTCPWASSRTCPSWPCAN